MARVFAKPEARNEDDEKPRAKEFLSFIFDRNVMSLMIFSSLPAALAIARENDFLERTTLVLDESCWRAADAIAESGVYVVLDGDSETEMLSEVAWTVAARGWHLNVLVNLSRLGDAHTTLRGTPCTLQGWWFSDEMVRFSSHERP